MRPLIAILLLAAASCTTEKTVQIPVAACPAGEPQTIAVLVRHADRDGELLNAAGQQRARDLRDLLIAKYGHVDSVVYTTYERTRQTVAPTLEASLASGDFEVGEQEIDSHDSAAFAGAIRARHALGAPRSVLLIAGHSDNIRPILEQFNIEEVNAHAAQWFPCDGGICHGDYDNLWTITLCGAATPEIRATTFGAPTP